MRIIALFICSLLTLGATVSASPIETRKSSRTGTSSAKLFEKYKSALARVSLIDKSSKERASVGSGFFVSANKLITNYHVVAEYLRYPERYKLEIETNSGTDGQLSILGFDLINDLAVLSTSVGSSIMFKFAEEQPAQGAKLFSLGHPLDLGSAIIEGTFNGVAERTFPERLHFSGAVNSGMSGGPAIEEGGKVVGVNVSTYGNEVSFLVPAKFVQKLVESGTSLTSDAKTETKEKRKEVRSEIGSQLRTHTHALVDRILSNNFSSSELGPYLLPGSMEGILDCWSDFDEGDMDTARYLGCSSGDEVFVDQDLEAGAVSFRHLLLTSTQLNGFQFNALSRDYLLKSVPNFDGSKRDFSGFKCEDSIISINTIPLKIWQCLRKHKRFKADQESLYDGVVTVVGLEGETEALQSSIVLTAVTFPDYLRFTQRILSEIKRTGAK